MIAQIAPTPVLAEPPDSTHFVAGRRNYRYRHSVMVVVLRCDWRHLELASLGIGVTWNWSDRAASIKTRPRHARPHSRPHSGVARPAREAGFSKRIAGAATANGPRSTLCTRRHCPESRASTVKARRSKQASAH